MSCLILGHSFSRRDVREDSAFQWRSVCQRCGENRVSSEERRLESRASVRAARAFAADR